MENRRKKSIADKLFFIFLFLIVGTGLFIGTKHLVKKVVLKIAEQPTVYMVYGEDTCRGAIDARGNATTCEEAMKVPHHTEWHAHETLNKN